MSCNKSNQICTIKQSMNEQWKLIQEKLVLKRQLKLKRENASGVGTSIWMSKKHKSVIKKWNKDIISNKTYFDLFQNSENEPLVCKHSKKICTHLTFHNLSFNFVINTECRFMRTKILDWAKLQWMDLLRNPVQNN